MSETRTSSGIVLVNCSIVASREGKTFYQGVVAPESVEALRLDDYQRGLLPYQGDDAWRSSFESLGVPAIRLGMRGDDAEQIDATTFRMLDPVFVVDGQQRRHAALQLMERGANPIVLALLETGTTWYTECEWFLRAHSTARPVTPNSLLRAMKHKVMLLDALYDNTTGGSGGFVLKGRVTWDDVRVTNWLVSAMTLVKVTLTLHRPFVTLPDNKVVHIAEALNRLSETVAEPHVINNVYRFFTLADELWELGAITAKTRGGSVVCKANFLMALARMFSTYQEFWDSRTPGKLVVAAAEKRRLESLKIRDKLIEQFVKGNVRDLTELLAKHVNQGRTKNRLQEITG